MRIETVSLNRTKSKRAPYGSADRLFSFSIAAIISVVVLYLKDMLWPRPLDDDEEKNAESDEIAELPEANDNVDPGEAAESGEATIGADAEEYFPDEEAEWGDVVRGSGGSYKPARGSVPEMGTADARDYAVASPAPAMNGAPARTLVADLALWDNAGTAGGAGPTRAGAASSDKSNVDPGEAAESGEATIGADAEEYFPDEEAEWGDVVRGSGGSYKPARGSVPEMGTADARDYAVASPAPAMNGAPARTLVADLALWDNAGTAGGAGPTRAGAASSDKSDATTSDEEDNRQPDDELTSSGLERDNEPKDPYASGNAALDWSFEPEDLATPFDDWIYTGDAGVVINALAGNDYSFAGDGDDVLHGEAGNDFIHAGSGADRVFGGSGDDIVHLGSGDDLVVAGTGNDIVFGGDGNDVFVATDGDGDNVFLGGAGVDAYDARGVASHLVFDLQAGEVRSASGEIDYIAGVEMLLGGASDDLFIDAANVVNVYTGGDGNDVFAFQVSDGPTTQQVDMIRDFQIGDKIAINKDRFSNETVFERADQSRSSEEEARAKKLVVETKIENRSEGVFTNVTVAIGDDGAGVTIDLFGRHYLTLEDFLIAY